MSCYHIVSSALTDVTDVMCGSAWTLGDGFAPCCDLSHAAICTQSELCYNPYWVRADGTGTGFLIASCTDASYESGACNKHCVADQAVPDVVYNNATGLWACCGTGSIGSVDCTNPTTETFQAASPEELLGSSSSILTASATPPLEKTSSQAVPTTTATRASIAMNTMHSTTSDTTHPTTSDTAHSITSNTTHSITSITTHSTTSTKTHSTTTSTSAVSGTAGGQEVGATSSSHLSTGAKAGIGVGVALGVFGLICIVAAFLIVRRKKGKRNTQPTAELQGKNGIYQDQPKVDNAQSYSDKRTPEMPGHGVSPYELNAEQSQHRRRELPG